MVSSEQKWSVEAVAKLIQPEVSFRRIELGVLDNIWFRVTNVPEDVIVKIKSTIVNSGSWLSL